jgi:transcriptional regulator with XRE-family HTH domain
MRKQTKDPLAHRKTFAANLRRLRRLSDVTQEELALRSGLDRSYLSSVEQGAINIGIDNMGRLAEALGVQLHQLLDPDLLRI